MRAEDFVNRQFLGVISPSALVDARNATHRAAQVLAAVGETHLEHEADTSHTAMAYDPTLGALVNARPIEDGLRGVLWLDDLAIGVTRRDHVVDRIPLSGRTLDDAFDWMQRSVAIHSDGERRGALRRPTYPLPDHGLEHGDAFDSSDPGSIELGKWFRSAHSALESLPSHPDDGPIVCWPHHFDLAILRTVARDASDVATKTIGVGLSPGDDQIPEPYWYVNHWPTTTRGTGSLEPLPVGEWHDDGFVAAVLRGGEIIEARSTQAQSDVVASFLEHAMRSSEELLS